MTIFPVCSICGATRSSSTERSGIPMCVPCGQQVASEAGAHLTPEQRERHREGCRARYGNREVHRPKALRMMNLGMSNAQIGKVLGLPSSTIKWWRKNRKKP